MTTSINRRLQQLEVSHNTTPSSNSTARKSKAGDVDRYEQEQVHTELAMDLEKASKCSFDQLLQYFQYLVLKPESAEKQELDRLQRDIEKLQLQRLYGETQTRRENTADGTEEEAAAREAGRKAALAREEDLIQKRDAIQNELLRRLLQVTLLISNQTEFKQLLQKVDRGFREGNEVARYKPFVELSNALLDEFEHFHKKSKPAELQKLAKSKKVDLDLPFRKADKLDIRFQVNHPTQIKFHYYGASEAVKRNPDVIVSSRAALARRSGANNEPDAPNDWVMDLCSVEFKRRFRNRRTFLGELAKILRHDFKLTLVEEHLQEEISKLDTEIDEIRGGQEGNERLIWGMQLAEDNHEEADVVQGEGEQEEDEQEKDEQEEDEQADDMEEDAEEGDTEGDVEQEEGEQEGEEQEQDEEDEEDQQQQQQREGQGQREGEEQQGDDNEEEDHVVTNGSRIRARSKRTRETAGFVADKEQPAAKKIRPLPTPSASGSRSMASVPAHEVEEPDTSQHAVAGRVQCASYALEMLSYSIGVHHAINILFTDGILWVWYYDRQGTIQSTGVSLFKDFPRFIALLFVLQRFSLVDWGIIPELNPEAVHEHKTQTSKPKSSDYPAQITLQNKSGPCLESYKDFASFWQERGDESVVPLSKVKLNTNEFLSHQPHCLSGRATAVVPAIGSPEGSSRKAKPMVCKVYHPEFQRRHEGVTTDVIYAIAQADELERAAKPEEAKVGDWDMFKHLPKVYFYGDLKGTSTHLVRSMVNCGWKGHRTARIIGMKRLQKVTTLEGWDFVRAWLDAVACHAFLWKNHVEHGDPSLGNVMYDEETKSGVLTDFDLSLLQWEPRVLGTERTGTVPFTAIELLSDKYWKYGTLIRQYYHELESFIWILPYVFLLFQEGVQTQNPLVDSWRTSDYTVCSEKKSHFYNFQLQDAGSTVQKSFAGCWLMALRLCKALQLFHIELRTLRPDDTMMKTALEDPDNPFLVIEPYTKVTTEEEEEDGEEEVEEEEVEEEEAEEEHTEAKVIAAIQKDEEAKISVLASETLWHKFADNVEPLKRLKGAHFGPLLYRLKYYKPSFQPLTLAKQISLQDHFHDILYPPSVSTEAEAPSP